jgi:hypothetical protein
VSVYAYTVGEDNVCHFPEPEKGDDQIGWYVYENIGIAARNPLGIIRGSFQLPAGSLAEEKGNIQAGVIG